MESSEPVTMKPPSTSLTPTTSPVCQPPTPTPTPPVTIMSLNYDVLARIFENIMTSKQQVLWAALTCRSFQCPAIDALWKSLHAVDPLFELLPTIEKVNGVYYLRGEISNHDKERFDFYAKKVRVLSFHGYGGTIDPSVLTVLSPLTCLQKFICSPFDELNAQNILLFLSATLREVTLYPSYSLSVDDFPSVRPFLYTLHKQAPHIRHLVLGRLTLRLSDSWLWDSLLRFQDLRSLELNQEVDLITLRNIVSLPELQRLAVRMDWPFFLQEGPLNSDKDTLIPCLKLRSLELSGAGPVIASYLSRMRGGCLSDISITMCTYSPLQNGLWEICLKAMEKQWASTLRHLHLSTKPSGPILIDTSPQFFISLSKIALEHLSIEGTVAWSQCHSLASANPHIKTVYILRLHYAPLFSRYSNINLYDSYNHDVFDEFAIHCPQLVSLSVDDFDDVYSPSAPSFPNHRYRHNQLRTLRIASKDSLHVDNLQHAIDVARHLDRIFPSLKVIHAKGDSRSRDFWQYVEKLLHEFQGERVRQETVGV